MAQPPGVHQQGPDPGPSGGREPGAGPIGAPDPGPQGPGAGDPSAPRSSQLLPPLWQNRREAGLALAKRLQAWRHQSGALVIGLPRGGVAVAAELAGALHLPLAPWAVRKLGHPADPEVAIGAIAPGGVVLWDRASLGPLGLSPMQQARLVADQQQELERRQRLFGDPEPAALRDRPLLVVDDGVATGMTVRAALASLRQCQPRQLVLAVPVIDEAVAHQLEPAVDGLVALARVRGLRSVGAWYGHFGQLRDATVLALLADHRGSWAP